MKKKKNCTNNHWGGGGGGGGGEDYSLWVMQAKYLEFSARGSFLDTVRDMASWIKERSWAGDTLLSLH